MAIKSDTHVEVDVDNVPEGMQVFRTVGHTIKDSTDSYRDDGDLCLLDEKLAGHYYDLRMIQPLMPEFNFGNAEKEAEQAALAEKQAAEDAAELAELRAFKAAALAKEKEAAESKAAPEKETAKDGETGGGQQDSTGSETSRTSRHNRG